MVATLDHWAPSNQETLCRSDSSLAEQLEPRWWLETSDRGACLTAGPSARQTLPTGCVPRQL